MITLYTVKQLEQKEQKCVCFTLLPMKFWNQKFQYECSNKNVFLPFSPISVCCSQNFNVLSQNFHVFCFIQENCQCEGLWNILR